MKKLLVVLVTFSFIATGLNAQHHRGENAATKAALSELHADMRSWFETSVYPTLKAWHKEYDASLSPEDLATLNQLRTQAKQLKEQAHKEMKQNFEGKKRDKREFKDLMRALKEMHRNQIHELVEQLKPIAKNSREKLLSIHDQGEAQIETWRAEAKQRIDAWKDKYEIDGKKMHRHGRHGFGNDFMPFSADGKRAAMKFMLWDGNMPPQKENAPFANNDAFAPEVPNSPQVFPNPTLTTARVEVNDVSNGPATIEIYSMDGSLLKSITTNVTGNRISEVVDISSLSAGTYMVSVNGKGGRKTTQLVIDR